MQQSKDHTMKKLIVALIRVYQTCSTYIWHARCRFYPSCSEYTAQAITHKGIVTGILLGITRMLKCHPFHPGGYDPVAETETKTFYNGEIDS